MVLILMLVEPKNLPKPDFRHEMMTKVHRPTTRCASQLSHSGKLLAGFKN